MIRTYILKNKWFFAVMCYFTATCAALLHVPLAVATSTQPSTQGSQLVDCDVVNDDIEATTPVIVHSGDEYEPGGANCDKVCNGPKECNPLTCSVGMSDTKQKTYNLQGSLSYQAFGIQANYNDSSTDTGTCSLTDGPCDTPNCCVGPLYVYLHSSYQEEVSLEYDFTKNGICKSLMNNCTYGSLVTFQSGLCTKTKHNEWETPMVGSTPACYLAASYQYSQY